MEKEFHKRLEAYLDGRMDESERRAFEAEVQSDPERRREMEQLEDLMALLREMPRQPAPGHMRAQILETVRTEKQKPAFPVFGGMWGSRRRLRHALQFGVACLVVIVAYRIIYQPPSQEFRSASDMSSRALPDRELDEKSIAVSASFTTEKTGKKEIARGAGVLRSEPLVPEEDAIRGPLEEVSQQPPPAAVEYKDSIGRRLAVSARKTPPVEDFDVMSKPEVAGETASALVSQSRHEVREGISEAERYDNLLLDRATLSSAASPTKDMGPIGARRAPLGVVTPVMPEAGQVTELFFAKEGKATQEAEEESRYRLRGRDVPILLADEITTPTRKVAPQKRKGARSTIKHTP